MNYQVFNQSGGFPFQTETLDELQKATNLFNKFGDIAGNFAIISGCEVTGSVVADGAVFINGELLEFRGGQIGTNVIIIELMNSQEFEDGNDRDVLFTRYATFGIGSTVYPWANFKRSKTTLELTEQKAEQTLIDVLIGRIESLEARPISNVPTGMIAIWDRPANQIPEGWIEYTQLKGKIPIGINTDLLSGAPVDPEFSTLGGFGGAKSKTLSIAEMPAHTHDFRSDNRDLGDGLQFGSNTSFQTNVVNQTTASKGESNAFSIMNPYRVVHFIKYVG